MAREVETIDMEKSSGLIATLGLDFDTIRGGVEQFGVRPAAAEAAAKEGMIAAAMDAAAAAEQEGDEIPVGMHDEEDPDWDPTWHFAAK